jgi:putative Mg2+ transporter-C (MgtC) family protein
MSTEQVIIRLIMSVIVGGIIGAEREYKSKSAGLRTLMLISLGASVFTMLSIELGTPGSPDRIASNIVTGIGFVGAGVIFKTDNRLNGITTAATIWVTAAIGMAIGAGHEIAAAIACICTLGVLILFSIISRKLEMISQVKRYVLTCSNKPNVADYFDSFFKENKLKIVNSKYIRKSGTVTGFITVEGKQSQHETLVKQILLDKEIDAFEFDDNN